MGVMKNRMLQPPLGRPDGEHVRMVLGKPHLIGNRHGTPLAGQRARVVESGRSRISLTSFINVIQTLSSSFLPIILLRARIDGPRSRRESIMIDILTISIALIIVGLLGRLQVRFSVPSPKVRLFHILWKSMEKGTNPCHHKKTGNNTHSVAMKGLLTR